MITEQIKIDTGGAERTVKDLKGELKELRNELLNTTKGTEEYAEVMQRAANIQHELKEQMSELNATAQDFGQRVSNVNKVIGGFAGGITAATGVMSLFGNSSSEAAQKITATMTSLIGLTQGLAALDEGQKAFHRLKTAIDLGSVSLTGFQKALIATGLGALVVVLGSLIANWKEVANAIGIGTETIEHFGDVFNGVMRVCSEAISGLGTAIARVFTGNFSGAMDALKEGFDVSANYAKGYTDSVNKLTDEQQQAMDKIRKSRMSEREKLDEEYNQLKEKFKGHKQELLEIEEWYNDEVRKINEKEQAKIDAERKKAEEEAKRIAKERAERAKQAKDDAVKAEKERLANAARLAKYEMDLANSQSRGADSDRFSQKSVENQQKYFDALLALYKKDSDEYKNVMLAKEQWLQAFENKQIQDAAKQAEDRKKELNSLTESFKTEQEKLDEHYNTLITKYKENREALLIVERWYAEEKKKIEESSKTTVIEDWLTSFQTERDQIYARRELLLAAAEQEIKDDQELAQTKIAIEEQTQNELQELQRHQIANTMNTYAAMSGAIGSLLNSLGENMKKGSKQQKAIQVAAATIQMLTGITTAMSGAFTTKTGPWDWALAAVQAATIAANGAKTIRQIKNTNPDGASSVSIPSVDLGAINAAAPDFTQTLDGARTESMVRDTRVYVLQSDIDDTHDKLVKVKETATY